MRIVPSHTQVVYPGDDIFEVLTTAFIQDRPVEKSVVAVTSKVVSLCESRVIPVTGSLEEKISLVRQEAEYYTEPHSSKYNIMLTVKEQILAVNAGIDESNADKHFVLFPEKPYDSATKIWEWLRTTYQLNQVGVIITDSRTFPLKWGVIGTCLSYCGFEPLNNKIGQQDLFGRELHMTQVNVAEALAVAAVLEMGEAAESQPVALITDAQMVQFRDQPPTQVELEKLAISIDDDAYAPILKKAEWHTGGKKK